MATASAPKLDMNVFGDTPKNHDLLKQAYSAYLANGRENLAVTKSRGLVSGGGKKPWRQKGTGRARFGSTRNPIWRGGGIAFGPTGEENYSKDLNTKAKRLAIRQALSLKADAGAVSIADLQTASGKTADLVKQLTAAGAVGATLIVVAEKTPELVRAARNLAKVKVVTARYINVFDTLNADTVLVSNDALTEISAWLGKENA